MNKKGQTLALAIMSSLLFMIVGFMLVNFLMPEVTNARANMSCSDYSNINDGVKLFCLATDSVVPYFIVAIFSLIIGSINSMMAI